MTAHRKDASAVQIGPVITALSLICLLLCWVPVSVADSRLRVIDYDPTAVVSLMGVSGYHVHIEFAPGEHYVNLGAGDTSVVDVGAEANHLFLKPRASNLATNLTIVTNRRVYYFDYRTVARAGHDGDVVYAIQFRYPLENGMARPDPASDLANAVLSRKRAIVNANYWFSGSQGLKPVSVDDDGLQTRLRFAPTSELPAIYSQDRDGSLSLVNTHSEDDSVYVHGVPEHLVLRRGGEAACIVDRGDRERLRRASSGTVDESVDRQVMENTR